MPPPGKSGLKLDFYGAGTPIELFFIYNIKNILMQVYFNYLTLREDWGGGVWIIF